MNLRRQFRYGLENESHEGMQLHKMVSVSFTSLRSSNGCHQFRSQVPLHWWQLPSSGGHSNPIGLHHYGDPRWGKSNRGDCNVQVSRTSSTGAVLKDRSREKVAVGSGFVKQCFSACVPASNGVMAKGRCPASGTLWTFFPVCCLGAVSKTMMPGGPWLSWLALCSFQ